MNRKTLLLLLLNFLLYPTLFAQSGKLVYDKQFAPGEGLVNKTETAFRKEICLNGLWEFQPVALPPAYQAGKGVAPELKMPEANAWSQTKIKIPSPWNINGFANRNLQGPDHRNYPSYPGEWEKAQMGWMKKQVTIPADWGDKQIKLHFEAVSGYTEVYVNKKKVAENFDLFLPFEADITDVVSPGESVEILVGVRNQSLFEDRSTKGRRIVPAGSMWGYYITGIWQDVFLVALPKIHIEDIYVKPLVSQNKLELEVTVQNNTTKKEDIQLQGVVNKWLNKAGTDVHTAPVPNWELGEKVLDIPSTKVTVNAGGKVKTTISVPVSNEMEFWTPEHPNLHALRLSVINKKKEADLKYERFGWREWTISGTDYLLNGKPIQLKGDSWHFMGVPQLTRRYAWAWFTALKDANANAVRPHAQVYPRFYMDVADEMGICVLAETANWASDGGPKLDSPAFWENSKDHLQRMILRDRNHASIFGWSISNENKPVILHVFNRPDWMPFQVQAWEDWRNIAQEFDPTRPWISADGEDDGDGILPVTVGHYGNRNSMKHWVEIGKPWGIGEHSMAYYGTPEQVSQYNGERAYESQSGRMEGLAYECYDLVAQQRENGASYVSVFNLAWYGLQPLPFGKRDLTQKPTLDDGIHFLHYEEGVPGVQPERMGAYCSTFNPGYDPALPLYRAWPMFDAIKAANAGNKPAWSEWSVMPAKKSTKTFAPDNTYAEVLFVGNEESSVKAIFNDHGVTFVSRLRNPDKSLIIADGVYTPDQKELVLLKTLLDKGADMWLWSPEPAAIHAYNELLPARLELAKREASSFIPVPKFWMENMVNSDFYFCEIQNTEVSQYGIAGSLANNGEVLLNACNTNWRKWNKQAEELKTAATLRSENEEKGPDAMFVRYPGRRSVFYVSTLQNFVSTEKGYQTLDKLLYKAGIPITGKTLSESLIDETGNVALEKLFNQQRDGKNNYTFYLYSPRPLDDLLIEPNMPKLDIQVKGKEEVVLNNRKLESLKTIPLEQGWNKLTVIVPGSGNSSSVRFVCANNAAFVGQLKTSFHNPEDN